MSGLAQVDAESGERATEAVEQVGLTEAAARPPFKREIRVWVCPDRRCPNYSGQSGSHDRDLTSVPNLQSDMNHTATTDAARPRVTGNRGECPDCRTAGRGSRQRIPMAFVVVVDPTREPVPPAHCVSGTHLPVGVPPV